VVAAVVKKEPLARDELPDNVRHQYLSTLRLCCNARGDDDGCAKQVIVLGDRLTGVEADPDP
jgi:hypothetical protein